uniref:Uncharacterized protein n=1 Tax=Kalanchoe fedtschenkoi TaxID=63787 RepID=A0A7N0V2G2_KALFE
MGCSYNYYQQQYYLSMRSTSSKMRATESIVSIKSVFLVIFQKYIILNGCRHHIVELSKCC